MALLINKPKRVVINTTATLTLNRAELVGYFAGNAYFSSTSNWDKVYFYYKDASGKQNISVVFPSGSNQATFSPSSKVRQSRWTLDKIVVRDFDRGFVALKRSSYYSALSECDIVVAVPNRTPSDIALSNSSILENTTFVGNLTATDPDIEDPLVYSVVSGFGDAASFQIVGNNALHFVNAPSYETKNEYSVKIRVTDSSDTFYEEAFTINVVDVSEAPSNITLSNNTIDENLSINTVIGTLTVFDDDIGATHTLSIVGGDTSSFNLNGNQLRSSEVFNYETKASYTVTIRATDNNSLTYDKTFNISVLNVNESPTGITISSSSINEYNSINAVVGVLTTADPDGNETFTYTLVSGDTSAFNINGNQLRASEVFDFETKSSYSITVRSTDSGGLTVQNTFTININNITEAPTNITLSASSINEYNSVNAVVATISSNAPTAQSVSYSLVGGDVASFNINGNQLRASSVFDYETKSSYSVTIRASVGGESFDKAFTISVNNIAEAPTDITLSASSINENAAVNTVIGTLGVVASTAQSATYVIIGGDTSSFNINGNQLRSSASFDFETKSSYSITIQATVGGEGFNKTFTISVNNIAEPPSDILLSSSSINENNAVNDVVGTLSAVGDSCTFSIVGGDTSSFNISGNQLRASAAFNFESKSSYSVTIRATTVFSQTFDKTFTITVNNVDESAPSGIQQWGGTIGGYALAKYSTASPGTVLFRVGIWDSDFSNDSLYASRGANNRHTLWVDECRLYYTDGSYTLNPRTDQYASGTTSYGNYSTSVVRLAKDVSSYYVYESDFSNNKDFSLSGKTPSYFWMRLRVYYSVFEGSPPAQPYVLLTMTFNY